MEVHIAHTSAGAQFKLADDVTSGLVKLGLVHKIGGAVKAMKSALRCLFRKRLRVYKGGAPPSPDTAEYHFREAILALFVNDTGSEKRKLIL